MQLLYAMVFLLDTYHIITLKIMFVIIACCSLTFNDICIKLIWYIIWHVPYPMARQVTIVDHMNMNKWMNEWIHLAFRFLISYRMFLCSLTLSNTSSFLTFSVQLIFSILPQHHIWKISRCFWSAAKSIQVSAPYKAMLQM